MERALAVLAVQGVEYFALDQLRARRAMVHHDTLLTRPWLTVICAYHFRFKPV